MKSLAEWQYHNRRALLNALDKNKLLESMILRERKEHARALGVAPPFTPPKGADGSYIWSQHYYREERDESDV